MTDRLECDRRTTPRRDRERGRLVPRSARAPAGTSRSSLPGRCRKVRRSCRAQCIVEVLDHKLDIVDIAEREPDRAAVDADGAQPLVVVLEVGEESALFDQRLRCTEV